MFVDLHTGMDYLWTILLKDTDRVTDGIVLDQGLPLLYFRRKC